MGRPRKLDRLTRTITARVPDDQYDWLVEDAVNFRDGDLSRALRYAIATAMTFERVLGSRDPLAELTAIIRRGEEEDARQVAEDEDRRAKSK
jgi:hypothetical protein